MENYPWKLSRSACGAILPGRVPFAVFSLMMSMIHPTAFDAPESYIPNEISKRDQKVDRTREKKMDSDSGKDGYGVLDVGRREFQIRYTYIILLKKKIYNN